MSAKKPIRPLTGLWLAASLLLVTGWLVGCTRPASQAPVQPAVTLTPEVAIETVQVTQGTGLYIIGRGRLPGSEDCVKTRLLENGSPAAWWPADVCVLVDGGKWEILVPLGRKGAPAQLAADAQFEVQAYWPEQPEETLAHFPFDLTGPKQP